MPTSAAIDNETLDHLLSDVDDPRNVVRPRQFGRGLQASKRADREIAQPQVGEPPLLPEPEQRPVQRLPQQVVAAADGDANALAKVTAFQVRPANKAAAIRRVGAVEPERQRDAIAEYEINLAFFQRGARGGVVRVSVQLGFG